MTWKRLFVGMSVFGLAFALAMVAAASARWSGYEAVCALLFPGVADPLGNTGFFQAGIAGGLFAGWSLTLLLLARDPVLSRSPALWTAIAWGLGLWFVLDSTASVLTGAAFNVIGNAFFLAGMLSPALILRQRAR